MCDQDLWTDMVPDLQKLGTPHYGNVYEDSTLEGMASLAALLEVWSQRIETLAADFAAGRAAVAPTARACKTCRLHGLCRVPAALDAVER